MKRICIALLVLLPTFAWAQASPSIAPSSQASALAYHVAPHAPRLTHNLSAAANFLEQGQCTIGLQLAACGLTPRLSIGSSVWLWESYGMANGSFRYKISENEFGDRWGFQAAYFKTYNKRRDGSLRHYDMEAMWLVLLRSYKLAPYYTLHLNFQTNWYFNDKMPFSLRRPIPGRSRAQVNFSTLHEVDLVNGWFILGEIGLLDFVQPLLYVHSGASIGRATKHWSWHAGVSVTGTPKALFSPTRRIDYQQILRTTAEGFDQPLSYTSASYDYGLHPEFSLQFYF
ncbi:MAG: hypothetical protein KF799_03900 [Bdellovibrionales bacterium]|nr:hypothetical protein [Bdellovibrionales bacterium]